MRRLLYVNCTFYHLYTTIATTPRDGYCVSVTLGDSGDHFDDCSDFLVGLGL